MGSTPSPRSEPGDHPCFISSFGRSVVYLSSLSGEFGQQVMRDILGHSGTSRSNRDLDEAKTPNRRLDSWKEIASFFRRDERTVKRWEKERGLPVHRLQDGVRGPVYAFTDELSRWMKSPASAEAATSSQETSDADVGSSAPNVSQVGVSPPLTPSQDVRELTSARFRQSPSSTKRLAALELWCWWRS